MHVPIPGQNDPNFRSIIEMLELTDQIATLSAANAANKKGAFGRVGARHGGSQSRKEKKTTEQKVLHFTLAADYAEHKRI